MISINLQKLVNTNTVTVVCLILAITTKAILFYHFFAFDEDKLLQSIAAKNLAEGKGLVYYEVHAVALDQKIEMPLNRWPPGYSLLVAGLYKITNNLIASTLILDLFFIVLYFVLLFFLLKILNFPDYLSNLIILLNGFLIAPYIGTPTDFLAATLGLLSIYLSIRFYLIRKCPLFYGILIGILCFLPSFFRYMYIPSVFVIGAVLLYAGTIIKSNIIRKGAITALIVAVLLTGISAILVRYHYGPPAYMPMKHGFFPANLLGFYPFFLSSFFNLNLLFTQLEIHTNFSYEFWYQLFVAINLLLFVPFIFHLFVVVKAKRSIIQSADIFILLNIGITIVVCLLVAYFSVSYGQRITLKAPDYWTFASEGRFHTLTILMSPLVLWLLVATKKRIAIIVKYGLTALVIFQVFHTSYFLARNFSFITPIKNAALPFQLKEFLAKEIKTYNEQHIKAVVTGDRETVSNWATLNGANALLNSDEIIGTIPKSKRPAVLILVVSTPNLKYYTNFLKSVPHQSSTTVGNYYVYICAI